MRSAHTVGTIGDLYISGALKKQIQNHSLPDTLKQIANHHLTLLVAACICFLMILACSNRFIQDDAFISYRYAANLAHGNGLVWNPGEHVEGYTNFLWTVLVTIPFFLALDPVKFSYAAGLFCFILTLVFTYRLSLFFSGSRYQALLVVLILGTNYTFNTYATGGMETQLQALLFTAATWLAILLINSQSTQPLKTVLLSFIISMSLLTRLDSAIPAAVLIVAVLFAKWRQVKQLRVNMVFSVSLIVPIIFIVGSWLTWKYSYYGSFIPNTYYAKVPSSIPYMKGLFYVYMFFHSYVLVPFIFIAFFGVGEIIRKHRLRTGIILAILFLWLLYIVMIGGDFMEYRFLVPMLPLLVVFITELLASYIRQRSVQTALVLMIFFGSLLHGLDVDKSLAGPDIETIRQMKGHLTNPDENWIGIGKKLGELFGKSNVIIATTAAGAIPYYSHLATVDMFGLNDPWVARHGAIVSTRPGHQRGATLQYLIDRKVNIIIGHPVVRLKSQETNPVCSFAAYHISDAREEILGEIPSNFKILEIPIDDTYKLVALYFFPNPAIEDLIQRNIITAIPIQIVTK